MTQPPSGVQPDTSNAPAALPLLQRIADKVSFGMGTPQNIVFWLVVVATWIALGPYFAHHSFLPAWFTSNGFNFPFNTVTTILEMFIGYLVGASANRSERNLEATLALISAQERQVSEVEDSLRQEMAANTALTQQVHELATTIRRLVAAPDRP
jgi:hypothetical protein